MKPFKKFLIESNIQINESSDSFLVFFNRFDPDGFIVTNPSKKLINIIEQSDMIWDLFKKGKDYKGNVVILSMNDESCWCISDDWYSANDFTKDLKNEIKNYLDKITDKEWDEYEQNKYVFQVETDSLPALSFDLKDNGWNRNNITVDKVYKEYIDWMNNAEIDGDSGSCYFMVDLDKQMILNFGNSSGFDFMNNNDAEKYFSNEDYILVFFNENDEAQKIRLSDYDENELNVIKDIQNGKIDIEKAKISGKTLYAPYKKEIIGAEFDYNDEEIKKYVLSIMKDLNKYKRPIAIKIYKQDGDDNNTFIDTIFDPEYVEDANKRYQYSKNSR